MVCGAVYSRAAWCGSVNPGRNLTIANRLPYALLAVFIYVKVERCVQFGEDSMLFESYGTVCCGFRSSETLQCGAVRCGSVRCGVVRCGAVEFMEKYDGALQFGKTAPKRTTPAVRKERTTINLAFFYALFCWNLTDPTDCLHVSGLASVQPCQAFFPPRFDHCPRGNLTTFRAFPNEQDIGAIAKPAGTEEEEAKRKAKRQKRRERARELAEAESGGAPCPPPVPVEDEPPSVPTEEQDAGQ